MIAKKQSEQHLIDRDGVKLLQAKLPRHWVLHDYRPDYGLDFALETFRAGEAADKKQPTYETLGEHLFIQLKSVANPRVRSLKLFGRRNVEKAPEKLDMKNPLGELDTYAFQLERSELATVERMGVGVPVLLVVADLAAQRCSFVCLSDYIDKILIPRHDDYHSSASRTIQVPVRNEIGTEYGQTALRWYAKRAKLMSAFQRFTYQHSELQWLKDGGKWRVQAEYFARRIAAYDFWSDTEMWGAIPHCGAALERFRTTGQPGLMQPVGELGRKAFREQKRYFDKVDVLALWDQLANLPKMYEDICREWYLPTGLGAITSAPEAEG